MVFSSSIFLFLFLPIFLGCYYLTPFKYRSYVILIGSYLFYAWWRIDFVALFFVVTAWNYIIAIQINKSVSSAKSWLVLGLSGNLSVLAYFKYANFGIDSLNQLIVSTGGQPLSEANIILPIGISFYIFQAISYLMDVYRKDTEPTRRFIDFAAFIALFPQLIAGPVLRYKDLAHQFESREHSWSLFGSGVAIFMQGFIKKVLIADNVAPVANWAFSASELTFSDAWLGALAYSIQLYFDFSGYSDMAVGLGLMMGFVFINNFNQPYISQSITEFWRRWHISLSSWLRDYLYISLGGNRHGVLKTYRNLFLTMLLGGLWHGANWTFVLWGMWHGLLLSLERATGIGINSGFSPMRWLLTLTLVMLGWVVFRAESLSSAILFYQAMLIPPYLALSESFSLNISSIQLFILAIGILVVLYQGFSQHFAPLAALNQRNYLVGQTLRAPLFLLALSSLIASSYSPFLYFQF